MQVSHLEHVEFGDNSGLKDCSRVVTQFMFPERGVPSCKLKDTPSHKVSQLSSSQLFFHCCHWRRSSSSHSFYMGGRKSGQEMEIKLSSLARQAQSVPGKPRTQVRMIPNICPAEVELEPLPGTGDKKYSNSGLLSC